MGRPLAGRNVQSPIQGQRLVDYPGRQAQPPPSPPRFGQSRSPQAAAASARARHHGQAGRLRTDRFLRRRQLPDICHPIEGGSMATASRSKQSADGGQGRMALLTALSLCEVSLKQRCHSIAVTCLGIVGSSTRQDSPVFRAVCTLLVPTDRLKTVA